jgi:hypothetical protein
MRRMRQNEAGGNGETRCFIICTLLQIMRSSKEKKWGRRAAGKIRNKYKVLVGKRDGKIILGKPIHR